MILHPLVENAVKYCGFDSNHSDQGLIRVDVTMAESFVLISIENTIGPKDLSSNIGFKKGVEIVQESINIYKKMGLHHLKFKESVNPIHFHPGFRCEVLIFLS
jgi:LytS/YehU family sensor histidine kinase